MKRALGSAIVGAALTAGVLWLSLGGRSGAGRVSQPADAGTDAAPSVADIPASVPQVAELQTPDVPEPARIVGRILLPAGITLPEGEHDWTDVRVECSRLEPDPAPLGFVPLEDVASSFVGLDTGAVGVDDVHAAADPDGTGQPRTIGRPADQPRADGSYAIEAPPLGVPLRVRVVQPFGPDFVRRVEALRPGEQRELAIALERGRSVRGVVLDARGSPATEAEVWLADVAGDRRRGCKVGPGGAFSFEGLAPDSWVLTAEAGELLESESVVVDAHARDVAGVVLSLGPRCDIELDVFWPDGALVESFGYRYSSDELRVVSTGASHAGVLRLRGLPLGSYEFDVWAERGSLGGKAHVSAVTQGHATRVALEPLALCELRGRVLDGDGRPVRNCKVLGARVSGDGRFVMSGLHPGTQSVWITAPGYLELDEEVELEAGEPRELTFVLERGCTVRGTVLDPEDHPVALADVWLGDPSKIWGVGRAGFDANEHVQTSLTGGFEFAAKTPVVSLGACLPGFAPSELVRLDVRGHRQLEAVLHLRTSAGLEGRVLDADGRPASAVSVEVRDGLMRWGRLSDLDGRFQFADLPAGTLRVEAEQPSRSSARRQLDVELVAAQSASVELRLPAPDPVRVHGRVTWRGEPLRARLMFMADFSGTLSCKALADGSYEAELFAPGDWDVSIDLDGELPGELRDQYVRRIRVPIPDAEEHELQLEIEERLVARPPRAPR